MRKRGATFLLEKSLVSRLPFEVEQPLSSTFPPPKRIKPATSSPRRDDNSDERLEPCADAQSERPEMQEVCQNEDAAAASVEVGVAREKGCRGCWWAEARDKRSEHEEAEGKEPAPAGTAGNSGEDGSRDNKRGSCRYRFLNGERERRPGTSETLYCSSVAGSNFNSFFKRAVVGVNPKRPL